MKNLFAVLANSAACICLDIVLSSGVAAQSSAPEHSNVPKSAFFVGAGASYAFTTFPTQSVYNKGLSNVYVNGVLNSTGSADGPPVPASQPPQSNAAPVVQWGYFGHFGDSPWLWGGKVSYSYIGATSSVQNLIIPQYGQSSNPNVSTFTGYSVTGSYSVSVHHQASFMPFVGRQFDNSFVYAGAGLSISQVQASLNNVVGWATINGVLTDISGAPQSFSTTTWNTGAAATVGVTFFLGPAWFLDLNYAFSMPNARTNYVTSPFSNPGTGGTSYAGTLIGTFTQNTATQAVGITINRTF